MPGTALADSSSEVLGSDNSSWPLTSRQHLLIQHMPKTSGTSFRKMVFRSELGKTLQAHMVQPSMVVQNSTQSTRRKS